MLTVEIDGVELDYCGADRGVWFDEGEIEALFQSRTPILPPAGTRKGKRCCPRCASKLHLVQPFPGLEIDVCAHGDGVWFDAGEVGRLTSVQEIAFARQYYNDSVMAFANKRQEFPGVIVAGMFNFKEEPYWKIEEAPQREAPKVRFGQ